MRYYFAGMFNRNEDFIRIAWKKAPEGNIPELAQPDFFVKGRSLALHLDDGARLHQILSEGMQQLQRATILKAMEEADETEEEPTADSSLALPEGNRTASGIVLPFMKPARDA